MEEKNKYHSKMNKKLQCKFTKVIFNVIVFPQLTTYFEKKSHLKFKFMANIYSIINEIVNI